MRAGSNTPNLANASGNLPMGCSSAGCSQLLFVLRVANMQSTADQQFTKVFGGTNYVVTNIIGARKTGAASVVCAGGIYTAASKGGDAIVGVSQSWVTLASGVMVSATLAGLVLTTIESATPYLSLTTGSSAACTADVFIFGLCID